ncbi:hypothetical protein [Vitiosangium sp. GDMCC 1.1324]|uniref:hypothetical protein n=1 Tax=Vitiosangium sp. (strain GDMCC 1.1324) TaxID=2138576 RepID=UPI000D3AF5B4|nr:hypothetical protein [Vitiosangium sp. GDMCC 1.1324]PTL80641.1 hypothetical protein DAT35_28875 [Vitiosangium sp. GDMCC 1.1324]
MQPTNGNNTLSELTLEQVRDSIINYLEQGNSGHYNIGRLYNHTVDHKLAEKNGYENAQAFFNQHIKALSQAMLTRYGAVARQFTEEACRKYGVTNLLALRAYAVAANIQPTSGDPGPTPIDVPQEGGNPVQKSFSECSVAELKLAVKHKRAPSRANVPTADSARVEFIRESFARHFAQRARVQLKTSVQGGETVLTIQGVPLKEVDRLMEALLDGFMPQPVRAAG